MSEVASLAEADGQSAAPPVSYYQMQEMNRNCGEPRLERVPSQYQLESLSEPFVFDQPTIAPPRAGQEKSPLESSMPPFVPSHHNNSNPIGQILPPTGELNLPHDERLFDAVDGHFPPLPLDATSFEVLGDSLVPQPAPMQPTIVNPPVPNNTPVQMPIIRFEAREIEEIKKEVSRETRCLHDNMDELNAAPKIVTVMHYLTIIAVYISDPSLVTPDYEISKFTVLRNPESFQSSLKQMIDAIYKIFVDNNTGMLSMGLRMSEVPRNLADSIKLLTKTNGPLSRGETKILQMYRRTLENAVNSCVTVANDIYAALKGAEKIIDELTEGAKAAHVYSDKEAREITKEKAELSEEKEASLKHQERIKEQMLLQDKRIQEAYEDHRDLAKKGRWGRLAVAFFTDCVSSAALAAHAGLDFVKEMTGMGADNQQLALTYEKQLQRFLTEGLKEPLDTPEKVAENRDLIKQSFHPYLQVAPVTECGQNVAQKARQFLKSLDDFKIEDSDSFKKVSEAFSQLKLAVEVATEARQQQREKEKQNPSAVKNELKDLMAQAKQHIVDEQLRGYQFSEQWVEKLYDVAALTAKMQSRDKKKVELEKVTEYLQYCLKHLILVKNNWWKISRSCISMKIFIDNCVKETMDKYLQLAGERDTEQVVLKELLTSAFKSYGYVQNLMISTFVSMEVDHKFVFPRLDAVSENLGLSEEEAKKLLKELPNFTALEREIKDFIEEKKRNMEDETNRKLQDCITPFQAITLG